MTRRAWVPVALVTAVALLAGACTSSDPGTPPDSAGPVAERAAFAPGEYREGDLDQDVAALAGWGIPTYEDEHATEPMVEVTQPEAPLRLLRDQVEVMGTEAAAGVGTLGADLDGVFAVGAGSELRMSALLAAWLQSGSDMATDLREALTTVDLEHPEQTVFPTIVLTGFIRDLSVSPGSATDPATSPVAFMRATAALDPCSVSSDWVEKTLEKLFEGLRINPVDTSLWDTALQPLGWVVNLFISVYEAIRAGAQWVVIGTYKVLVQPIRDVLAQISLLAAVVQTALTSIHPLTSTWNGPGEPEFGVIGDAELRYEATVHVRSTNPLVWPDVLRRCAKAAGVELPNPSLEGSRVTWHWQTAEGGVLRELDSDRALSAEGDGGGKASFRFATGQEPREWKERGDTNFVQAAVTATVERKNKQIRDAVNFAVWAAIQRLFAFLPAFLRQHAEGAIRSEMDKLLETLVIKSKYQSTTRFFVKRHMKPEETPTPTPTMPTPSPPPPVPVWVYVDRPGIPGAVKRGRILQLVACGGIAGTWRGKLRTGGFYDNDGFEVPWSDLPVSPFRIGNGGIGSTTSQASGKVWVPLPGQMVDVTYDLRITVDGRAMTVDGVPVQAPVSFRNIPIRKAPKGVCP